jgi:hypothetical protein
MVIGMAEGFTFSELGPLNLARKVPHRRDDISHFLPQINHRGEISHHRAALSKTRKELKKSRLTAVQQAGAQNVTGLES